MGANKLRMTVARKQVEVDCLGPLAIKKPHKFWSSEPWNRVCKMCRKKQDANPVPPLLERIEKAEPQE